MARNELHLNELELSKFDFNDKKNLVAELSDFGRFRPHSDPRFGNLPWFCGQIWNDSCDVGIAIRSHFTEKVEKFYFDHADENSEGEVAGFWFKPVNKNCKVKAVLVIND